MDEKGGEKRIFKPSKFLGVVPPITVRDRSYQVINMQRERNSCPVVVVAGADV